ncbi:hypothetical protein IscW_ISCW004050 [Ixodes scapularis]|uniref:CUB domain-containing protein n=1 Tax=Ixodes scapularis TaxID=6945 RepID=B7PJX5_IXOSC|nr:hypothetical protein IscW_ISCW004050 [Ixodes scapularis]|eukprot:XP_002408811.1 hypothetical protein IscW_ISCW004050 [Ixodes scapularis]
MRSHYLTLRDAKATMSVYSHKGNTLPRTVQKCRLQFQTESHAKLTLTFVKLDTTQKPFVCYMYLKLYMSDRPDVVCGRDASSKSISTTGPQMALEWVINSGGDKPGGIHMVLTSYRDSGEWGAMARP